MFCQCDIISHNIPYTEIYIIKFLLRPLLPKLGIYIGILRGKSRVELSGGILSVKTTSMGTLYLFFSLYGAPTQAKAHQGNLWISSWLFHHMVNQNILCVSGMKTGAKGSFQGSWSYGCYSYCHNYFAL